MSVIKRKRRIGQTYRKGGDRHGYEEDGWRNPIRAVTAENGRLDVLVNNAGVAEPVTSATTSVDD